MPVVRRKRGASDEASSGLEDERQKNWEAEQGYGMFGYDDGPDSSGRYAPSTYQGQSTVSTNEKWPWGDGWGKRGIRAPEFICN